MPNLNFEVKYAFLGVSIAALANFVSKVRNKREKMIEESINYSESLDWKEQESAEVTCIYISKGLKPLKPEYRTYMFAFNEYKTIVLFSKNPEIEEFAKRRLGKKVVVYYHQGTLLWMHDIKTNENID